MVQNSQAQQGKKKKKHRAQVVIEGVGDMKAFKKANVPHCVEAVKSKKLMVAHVDSLQPSMTRESHQSAVLSP